MPEHLRALVVILVLAGAVFAFARPLACDAVMKREDFVRRRNLWFAITLAAFLAHNFWIFILFVAALLVFALPHESSKLALFLFVLFAAPGIPGDIPGLGMMQYFFSIEYPRLLALALLLPAYLSLRGEPGVEPFGRSVPDKLLAAYLILQFLVQLPHTSFTDTLRQAGFYAFTDVFLPYYVASRLPRNLAAFRDTLAALALAALVLGVIAIFEFARRWLLYPPLEAALDMHWGLGNYLLRGESVRAQGSTGQPIVLGYVLTVAAGLFLYVRTLLPATPARAIASALLAGGIVAAMSRGPWVGAAVTALAFVATGPKAVPRLVKLAVAGALLVPLMLALPAGQAVVDHLPFVGTVETENVIYRQRLLDVSVGVVLDNAYFGAFDFMQLPVMQQLRQGQGIIDVVNTYLLVALSSGLVGLALFCGFFAAVALGVANAMRHAGSKNDERYVLGQALLATLLGILVMISTTSNIGLIPVLYWSVGGLCLAYARMLALSGVSLKKYDSRVVAAG